MFYTRHDRMTLSGRLCAKYINTDLASSSEQLILGRISVGNVS